MHCGPAYNQIAYVNYCFWTKSKYFNKYEMNFVKLVGMYKAGAVWVFLFFFFKELLF